MRRLVPLLFGLHLAALFFGLAGMLIAMPHPELWSGNAAARQAYSYGIQHGGATHMILGAATMLAFGFYAVGWRKTLTFFVVGTIVPCAAELMGTATGWPFGGYAYTSYLGFKLAGRVPYSVPLSWFYMGFASYLLATVIIASVRVRGGALWTLLLGAWLLMAWDLVLDPAMASPLMRIHFWTWHEAGPYFGMPLRNLAGWLGTGLLFMALSRLLWFHDADARRIPVAIPFSLYVANVVWAMALSLSEGLWLSGLAAILLSVAPAALVWVTRARSHDGGAPATTDPDALLAPAARVRGTTAGR